MNSIAVLSLSKTIIRMIEDMLFGFFDIYTFNDSDELIKFNEENSIDLLILERTIGKYSAREILNQLTVKPATLLIVADKYHKETDGEDFSFIIRKPFQKEELREIISYLFFGKDKSDNKAKNNTVLLVDDSKIAREVTKSALSLLGYEVTEATNGKEALDILKKISKPDIIITDQEMPEMNGIDFAKNARNVDDYRGIPIIMATSLYDNFNLRKEAFNAGITEFIPKPVDDKILQKVIEKILEIKKTVNRNSKILLIDDSNTRRKAMASVLKSAGYNIITTNNAKQFIQLLEDNRFHICLVDFVLEDTTGTELIYKIRKEMNIEYPIIIYTAFDNIHAKKKLKEIYEAGANDYLLAPFEIEELVFKVNTWLNHYNLLLEYKNKEKLLKDTMTYDLLTNVLNRFNILKRGEEYFSLCKRKNFPMSILYLDIDHFKNVNDSYGHDIGDVVLKRFAETINNNIREEDVFGRLGGEEFLAVLPFTGETDALNVANKLRELVSQIEFNEVENLKITVSIGLAYFDKNKEIKNLDQLITVADNMLYKAKETGRNKVVSSSSKI